MIEIICGTKTPLSDMGIAAGICWKAPIDDNNKNINRALDCISSGHGRVTEYADVTVSIKGYSARCIRELYTHIIGTTHLQESTRYVNESGFEYFRPQPMNDEASGVYDETMSFIKTKYKELLQNGVSKEDAANILPLGMQSGIVLKINARALEHLANMRLCTRAYKEIRSLTLELKGALSLYSDEWKIFVDKVMVAKCERDLFCTESKCCGRALKKNEVLEAIDIYKFYKGNTPKSCLSRDEEIKEAIARG